MSARLTVAPVIGEPLVVHPGWRLAARDGPRPPRFDADGALAWIMDDATHVRSPRWWPEAWRAALAALVPGAPAPLLPAEMIAALIEAGALITPRALDARREAAGDAIATARASLARRRYATLSGVVAAPLVTAIARYHRQLIDGGEWTFGDTQCRDRFAAYDDPIARFFQHELAALVSAIAGEPFKPSYVYSVSYRAPAVLKRHTDREQCALSLTWLVDYEPAQDGPTPWPIHLDLPGETVTVHQRVGDLLLYAGCELPHHRGPLAPGHASTSLLLHYVPAAFEGTLR